MPDAILTSQQARAVDRVAIEQYGIPGIILMENAGRGCVEQLCTLGGCGPAAIFCGQGNNGGDGFVIARHLKVRGFDPSVYLIGAENRLSNDSQINYRSLRACGIPIETITQSHEVSALVPVWQRCSWLIDALLGTGASGPPREPMSTLIEAVNALLSTFLQALMRILVKSLRLPFGPITRVRLWRPSLGYLSKLQRHLWERCMWSTSVFPSKSFSK